MDLSLLESAAYAAQRLSWGALIRGAEGLSPGLQHRLLPPRAPRGRRRPAAADGGRGPGRRCPKLELTPS